MLQPGGFLPATAEIYYHRRSHGWEGQAQKQRSGERHRQGLFGPCCLLNQGHTWMTDWRIICQFFFFRRLWSLLATQPCVPWKKRAGMRRKDFHLVVWRVSVFFSFCLLLRTIIIVTSYYNQIPCRRHQMYFHNSCSVDYVKHRLVPLEHLKCHFLFKWCLLLLIFHLFLTFFFYFCI